MTKVEEARIRSYRQRQEKLIRRDAAKLHQLQKANEKREKKIEQLESKLTKLKSKR